MTRSYHFKHLITMGIQIYEDLYRDYLEKIKQKHITDYFVK